MAEQPKHTPTKEQALIYDFVQNEKGNAMIDAVAGAGKTTTIMECAKHIPEQRRSSVPYRKNVLFCAFNRKIVDELKAKFNEEKVDYVDVLTCHGLGLSILKDYKKIYDVKESEICKNKCTEIVRSNDFIKQNCEDIRTIYDFQNNESLAENFFTEVFEYADGNPEQTYYSVIKKRNENVAKILERIINAHNKYRLTLSGDNLPEFYETVLEHFGIFDGRYESKNNNHPTKEDVIASYLKATLELKKKSLELAQEGKIDYPDMLYLPYIWNLEPKWHYQYIFIDECQDLSKARQEIILKYQYKSEYFNGRIIAVGDPFQAIYGFDGADIDSFETMEKRIDATRFNLHGSFRCPRKVVKKAQEINSAIIANREARGHLRNIPRSRLERELKLGAMIIARKKVTLAEVVWTLLPKQFPMYVISEVRSELISRIKALFTDYEYNRIIDESNYWSHRAKVLRRNKHKLERLYQYDKDIDEIQEEWEGYKAVLVLCMNKLREWGYTTVKETVERIINDYLPEKITEENKDTVIRVLTIHQAKGLQSKYVFILDADLLPYERKNMLPWEETQERNLTYVAYTRSLSYLYLVKSEQQEMYEQYIEQIEDDPMLSLSDDELLEFYGMV